MWRDIATELEKLLSKRVGVLALLIELDRFVRPTGRWSLKNATGTDEAGEGPSGERATRKAEDVDFIAGHVIEDQEAIGVRQVLDQAFTEQAAAEFVVVAGADAFVVVDDLRRAVLGLRQNAGP